MSSGEAQNTDKAKMGRPIKKDINPKSFGGQLRSAREKKGIGSEDFAKMLKVQRPSVVRWERNQALPTPQNIDDINEILGTKFTRPPRTHASKGKPKKQQQKVLTSPAVGEQMPTAWLDEGKVQDLTPEEIKDINSLVGRHIDKIRKAKARLSKRRLK